MKTVLTIAGSDSSGGAGIQADLKTILANGAYGMSVITALTAQNTTGVTLVEETSAKMLTAQLDAVFGDITPDAVKIGMVPSPEAAGIIAAKLKEYKAANIVVDPVMVSTSGVNLTKPEAVKRMEEELFPLATLITPNVPELAVLAGYTIDFPAMMERAAMTLEQQYGCPLLAKGGHFKGDSSDDVLATSGGIYWYYSDRVDNPNTHGTGCTLSSAIAANLANGLPLARAIHQAKDYITGALKAGLDLGHGRGPIDHGSALTLFAGA